MLKCPFCNADLSQMELHEGRCPECGSILAWNDEDGADDPLPVAGDPFESQPNDVPPDSPDHDRPPLEPGGGSEAFGTADVAGVSEASGDSDVSRTARIPEAPGTSDTMEVDVPNGRGDGPKPDRATVKVDRDAPDAPSGDIDPKAFDTHQEPAESTGGIRETMRAEALTPRQTQALQTMWASSAPQNAPVRMTIKTGDPFTPRQDDLTVPERRLGASRAERRIDSGPDVRTASDDDYELIDVIGEGGVGVVYAARQTSVDRTVAVKMLRPEMSREFDQRRKFLAEAIVTGDLDHPNIVPIHELGAGTDGSLFYSMKRVSGTPWNDVLADKMHEENIEILKKVGDAVAFAHSRGVVHRDLKPENVMLGEFGEVMVMDWGIALPTAVFHRKDGITHSGGLGGTPAYMAPELATGPIDRIGPESDVYLLGGILFEIITGLTPHTGADVMECLEAAAANEIQPTSKSGELLNIALRAMATRPEDRYPTVAAFQTAIREYQSHTESIALAVRAEEDLKQAKKSSDYQDYARALFAFQEAYALWYGNSRAELGISAAKLAYAQCALDKGDFDLGVSLLDEDDPAHKRLHSKLLAAQTERNARQARLTALKRTAGMLVAVLFVVVTSAFFWVNNARREATRNQRIAVEERENAKSAAGRAKSEARNAEEAKSEALEQARRAKIEKSRADEQARRADQQKKLAVVEAQRAKAATAQKELAKQRTEYLHYLSQIALASENIDSNSFNEARRILAQYENSGIRHWEWARLQYLTRLASATFDARTPVDAVAFSPSGDRFVVGGRDGTARIWNTQLDVEKTPAAKELQHADRSAVFAVAWSPDGRLVATAGDDGRIVLWKPDSGERLAELNGAKPGEPGHAAAVTTLRFSYGTDNGVRWLVSGSRDRKVIVWDVERRAPAHPPLELHSRDVTAVDVDSSQSRIISAGEDGKIVVWKIDLQRRQANGAGGWIDRPKELVGYHDGPVYSVAFSPNGKLVVSGGYDNRVLVWNPDEVEEVDLQKRLRGEREGSPMVHVLTEHTAPVRSVAFSPDPAGSLVLSSSDDNTAVVWDAKTGTRKRTLRGHGGWVRAAVFSPEEFQVSRDTGQGAIVLSGGYDGRARLWRIDGYGEVREFGTRLLDGNEDDVLDLACDPQGRYIATAGKDRVVRIWNIGSGKNEAIVLSDDPGELAEGHEFLASTIAVFRDGSRFLTGAIDGTVRMWNVRSGAQLAVLRGTGSSGAVALSNDDRWIATGAANRDVLLWPVDRLADASVEPIRLAGHTGSVVAVAFSADGKRLVSGDSFGRCLVWDLVSKRLLGPLNGDDGVAEHSKRIATVAFLPDGKRVVTASSDKTVAFWNVENGRELGRVDLPDSVVGVDASNDGRLLAVAAKAGTSRGDANREDSVLRLYDVDAGRLLHERFLDDSIVSSVRLAGNGSHVVVAAQQWNRDALRWTGSVQRCSVQNGRLGEMTTQDAVGDVWTAVELPGRSRLLTVGGRLARIWNANAVWTADDPQPEQTFGPHGAVATVDFSPDGDLLVSAGDDGAVKIWNVRTRRVEQRLSVAGNRSVVAAAFSPVDSNLLLTAGGGEIQLYRRDAETGVWKEHGPSISVADDPNAATEIVDAVFAPDGKSIGAALNDGTAQIRSTAAGELIARLTRGGRTAAPLRCIAFSADGRWIVTGGESNDAEVWERDELTQTWLPIASLEGHPAPVNSISISRDRFRIITASDDKTSKLFDLRDLAQRRFVAGTLSEVLLQDRIAAGLHGVQLALQKTAAIGAPQQDAASRQRSAGVLQRLEAALRIPPENAEPDADRKSIGRRVEVLLTVIADQRELWLKQASDEAAAAKRSERLLTADELQRAATAVETLHRLVAGPEPLSEVLTLRAHLRAVTSVVFSPSGQFVFTGGRDGAALLWPATNVAPSIQFVSPEREFQQGDASTYFADGVHVSDVDDVGFGGSVLAVKASAVDAGVNGEIRFAPRDGNIPPLVVEDGVVKTAGDSPRTIAQIEVERNGVRIRFAEDAGGEDVVACVKSLKLVLPESLRAEDLPAQLEVEFRLSDQRGRANQPTKILVRILPREIDEVE